MSASLSGFVHPDRDFAPRFLQTHLAMMLVNSPPVSLGWRGGKHRHIFDERDTYRFPRTPPHDAGSLLSGSRRMAGCGYIIIAIPANRPPSTISANRVPENEALSMNMPRVNIGDGEDAVGGIRFNWKTLPPITRAKPQRGCTEHWLTYCYRKLPPVCAGLQIDQGGGRG